MDVARVLDLVGPFFEGRRQPWALVGGVALLAYGAARATFDVDLMSPRALRDDLVGFLEGNGFATLSVQAGFSNHQHPEPGLGRVDVIYVSGATADRIFAGCQRRPITSTHEALVPRPEHLVAMKAQAFARDQGRYTDLADLRYLLALPGLDLAEARGYFEAAGLSEHFEKLRAG
jgi:hypothetical protein